MRMVSSYFRQSVLQLSMRQEFRVPLKMIIADFDVSSTKWDNLETLAYVSQLVSICRRRCKE